MAPVDKTKPAEDAKSKDAKSAKDVAREKAKKEYKKLKSPWNLRKVASNLLVPAVSGALLYFNQLKPSDLPAPPNALRTCIDAVCAGSKECVQYPGGKDQGDYFAWSSPFNLARPVFPVAVVRPTDANQVAGFVQCAAASNVKVQARSGGHSYANYGLGGYNGSMSIDLRELRYVEVDKKTWLATIGAGSLLGDVDDLLSMTKLNRVFAHGVCPGVGIGGHATIGGLGPSSRMWGAALDHIVEVEVVTANGTIVRANEKEHSDLFWAVRGAGASFGIVTEFVMRTHEKPKKTFHFTHRTPYSKTDEIIRQFLAWQKLIADPTLDRRIGTEFTLEPDGSKMTATWFGTEKEFEQSGIAARLGLKLTSFESNWFGTQRWNWENAILVLSDVPTEFYSRSLGFTKDDLLSRNATAHLIDIIKRNKRRNSTKWFCIFDATGGKVAEPAMDATAYAHRDKVMFYQSYALVYKAWTHLSSAEIDLLDGIHDVVLDSLPEGPHTTYPGYIDPMLKDPQSTYWGTNLPRLQKIKGEWDAADVFHNPQSVRPLA